ncbi:hypothetical protein AVEN_273697-1 [Araneus ventricosus]|uniref:BTB domain-containing protein n=1 Tax=Araneus ventricosus TaxID=182803 RepID=A0A4Y2TS76_ARAVE|nr:hypothetical protein AVEN_273697-1 [Araneus ventricosus]
MEEMEFAAWEAVRKHGINIPLEMRIEDFPSAGLQNRQLKLVDPKQYYPDFIGNNFVSVFPDGFDKETEGWVVILTQLSRYIDGIWPRDYPVFWCTVSVIDIEGNSRFPRSFERDYDLIRKMLSLNVRDLSHAKYLERSLILNRADELLPEDVLTLRFDFYFDYDTFCRPDMTNKIYSDFLFSVPNSSYFKNEDETGNPNDISMNDSRDTLSDFMSRIRTLPQFDESRKSFGIYGIPPASSSISSDSLEHVWMFDTHDGRFLLSLDKRQDSVGTRLLKASPVIEKLVRTPMKEQREKRIEFPEVGRETLKNVLFFLEKGMLRTAVFVELVDAYKFSHLYEMEALRRKCAEEMVKKLEYPTNFEEVERIADSYSDEYLSELLDSRRHENENLEQPLFKMEDIPNSDCYI